MPSEILTKYGLSAADLATTAALVTFSVALVKKHLSLKGGWNFVAAIVSTGVWTSINYLPVPPPLVAGVLILVTATGGWQTVKDTVGKIGEDNLKPMGSAERGPSRG